MGYCKAPLLFIKETVFVMHHVFQNLFEDSTFMRFDFDDHEEKLTEGFSRLH